MPQTYTVKQGESLSGILKAAGNPNFASPAEWAKVTGFSSGNPNLIRPGEILTLPDKAGVAPISAPATQTPTFSNVNDVGNYLSSIQSGIHTTPNVQSVDDILKSVKESLPQNRPAAPSLTDTYTNLRTTYGLDTLETQISDIQGQIQGINSQFYTQQLDESGKPVAQNVIEGRISQEHKQAILKAQPLQDQLKTLTSLYQTKLNTIQTITELTGKDYQFAVSDYNDKYSQAISAITLARGLRQDQVSEQEKAVDNARADLQIYVNTIKEGSLDISNLNPVQQLQLNKLEVQAGFPVGFISSIKADPKANIVFTSSNNGVTQVGLRNPDGTITVQSYGTPNSGKLSQDDQLQKAFQIVAPQLQKVAGSDGYVSPDSYKKAKSAWISSGAKTTDFDSQFNGFVNPKHASDYGLTNYSAFEKAQRGS